MTIPFLIERLPTTLADFPKIKLVYLFGSQVTGHTGPMSDYDFAILDENHVDDLANQMQFQHAMVKLLETDRVDVVLLNRAPIELSFQVIATGELLYQKDLFTRVEFEAQILGKFGDYLPVLRSFNLQTIEGDAHEKRIQRYREALGRTQRTLGPARTASRSNSR